MGPTCQLGVNQKNGKLDFGLKEENGPAQLAGRLGVWLRRPARTSGLGLAWLKGQLGAWLMILGQQGGSGPLSSLFFISSSSSLSH